MKTNTHCPTCHRPFEHLKNEQKARTGQDGLEHEAAKSLEDVSGSCEKIYDLLAYHLHLYLTEDIGDGWVSGDQLRQALSGGDGPRRCRQLSEEYGVVIERKMDSKEGVRRQAYYRLGDDHEYIQRSLFSN